LGLYKDCSGFVNYKTYDNIYKYGCKKALTVEQLERFGIYVSFELPEYFRPELKKLGIEPLYVIIKNSGQLNRLVDLYKELPYVAIKLIDSNDDRLIRCRSHYFKKAIKE
jgi:hypothetical protein